MESQVHPDEQIKDHHRQFDDKIDDVKTSFGVVPCRLASRPGRLEVDASSKGRSQGQNDRRRQKDDDFGAISTVAELLNPRFAWDDQTSDHQNDGDKRHDGIVSLAI